ncbi:MAG: 30S ribosomal protein S6 [Candidatus Doudnabacteria bacterium]|nr:30S ribosomal protein S6 [Candidatus Doudnabacteria bacterium]
MYILSSSVPDSEEPALTKSFTDFVTESGGKILKVENLGKKKLAYPIKKTKNALYVLINFLLSPEKLHDFDHKVRVTQGIIRYLIINLEEHLIRQAKDLEEQKILRRPRPPMPEMKAVKKEPIVPGAKIEINLDEQIEKALEEDITK